jgi:hypothetical protein
MFGSELERRAVYLLGNGGLPFVGLFHLRDGASKLGLKTAPQISPGR